MNRLIDHCLWLGEQPEAELRAAQAGGVGAAYVQPEPQHPLDQPELITDLLQRTADTQTRVLPVGAATLGLQGQSLSNMESLKRAGCRAIGTGAQWIADARVMRSVMRYARDLELPVFIHAVEPSLAADGCAHAGKVATRLGLPGIPVSAETTALARDLALVEETGCSVHFQGISSASGAAMIADARARRLPVSADVPLANLFLTEMDLLEFNSVFHLSPPLRSQGDRDALRRAVVSGELLVASHHRPTSADAKLAPFPETAAGMSCVQLFLPLLQRLAEETRSKLPELLKPICQDEAPAELGPWEQFTVAPDSQDWHSTSTACGFTGWTLCGAAQD